jgi:hypothetical protein
MGKNILMICYYYPPLTDVGCIRSVAFATFFKKFGWNPYVLSVKNPDKEYCSVGNEKTPKDIPVFYSFSLFNVFKILCFINGIIWKFFSLFNIKLKKFIIWDYVCIPDIFVGWIPLAIYNGLKIIKKEQIDLIYVSVSPVSSAIVGLFLKKITGKPVILDYRDPFGVDLGKYQPGLSKGFFRKNVNKWMDNFFIKRCDLFTVTTKETEELYRWQFPAVNNKIHTIYNGFDHFLLYKLNNTDKFSKFTIIYTGNFYFEIDYKYFIDGLFFLKNKNIINKDNFQFLFYGEVKKEFAEKIKLYALEELVVFNGRVKYFEVLGEIQRSHFQLLRIIQPMISTKFFEGIALNIPFIATVPKGEVEQLIRKYSPSSYIITDESAEAVALSIIDAMKMYENNSVLNNDVDKFLANFSREKAARDMVHLFESVLNPVA